MSMDEASAEGSAEPHHGDVRCARGAGLPARTTRSVARTGRSFAPALGVILALVLLGSFPGSAQTTTTTTAGATTTTAAPTSSTDAATTTTAAPATTAAPTSTTDGATTTAAGATSSTDAGSATTGAGSSTSSDADKAKVEAAESSKAREIDAANARLEDLSEALGDLEAEIEAQSALVDIAGRRMTTAQAIVQAAEDEVAELEVQVKELEFGLSDQAIRSFKGEVVDMAVLVGNDPNKALRMQAMLAKATQSDIDYANQLATAKEDLLARRRDAETAAAEADASRAESEKQLNELEENRLAQGDLAAAAETRLDHLLSERAALARLGADVDAGLDVNVDEELVTRLANAAAPAPSRPVSAPVTVSDGEIRSAGNGIMVHETIVDDVRRLLADAAADGVALAGGGYRDPAGQIAVRRNNCGTSNYAIYEMPSSQCRPPTARPGRSMHEQGRAIDFTYNGSIIRSRSGPAWNWLKANAEKYGLYNLPSEPWHWSTNGR